MISKAFGSRATVTGGRIGGACRNWLAVLTLGAVVLAGARAEAQSPFVAVRSAAVLPDGRIVIGGDFTNYNGVARARVARLNRDLSLDTTFDPALGPDGSVNAVAVQGDGKVLIGGSFTNVAGVLRIRLARLNADGSLDGAFDPLGGVDGPVNSVGLQEDGSMFIAGDFVLVDGFLRSGLAKLNGNGSVNFLFATGIGADGPVKAMVVQPDGKIVIAGEFLNFNATNHTRVARVNPNGSIDTTFSAGTGPDGTVEALALQPDGKIVMGGAFTYVGVSARASVARLNLDGTHDATFVPGIGPNGTVKAVAVQANGKVLIGGDFRSVAGLTREHIARLSSGGTNEASFSAGTGANAPLSALVVEPDGTILVGGAFSVFDGLPSTGVALVVGEPVLQLGALVGTVIDAVKGSSNTLSGVLVSIGGQTVVTDFQGNFTVTNLPLNVSLVLSASAPGYATFFTDTSLFPVLTNTLQFSMSPQLGSGGGMRFVFDWQSSGRFSFNSFDSHLLTPYPNPTAFFNSPHHIYSSYRGSSNSVPFASLDAYSGFFGGAPETMTISTFTNGTYEYYLEDRSFGGGFVSSGAIVRAYTPDGLVASARVPSGSANFWSVFRIDGATHQISMLNELTFTPPGVPSGFFSSTYAPTFSLEPQNATPRPGQSAMFTVVATNFFAPFFFTPLTLSYQWRCQGTNIPGATNASLTIPNAQAVNEGAYTVSVSNIYGTITSSKAYLALRAGSIRPAVVTLSRNQTVLEGYSANFDVTAVGLPNLRYQWQFNGTNLPSATNASFTIFSARPEDAGAYTVTISNRLGGAVAPPISLTVVSVPNIVVQPVGTNAELNARVTLSVAAVGTPPLTYRWRRDGFNVPFATSDTLTITNLQPGDVGGYEVIISNEAGAALSTNVPVRIVGAPLISQPPADQEANVGESATFNVLAVGNAPLAYQWRFRGANLGGETNALLTVTNVQAGLAGTYSVVVSNALGSLTNFAELALIGFPQIVTQPEPQVRLLGSTVTFSIVAQGIFPLVYQWFTNGAPLPGATNDSLVFTNVQPGQAAVYSVLVTNPVGSVTSSNAQLSVVGPPISIELAGPNLVVNVPVLDAGFVLEYADQLGAGAVWTVVTDLLAIPTAAAGGLRFYRLRKP